MMSRQILGTFFVAILPMLTVFLLAMSIVFLGINLPYMKYWFSPGFHTLGGFVTAWTLALGIHLLGPWGFFHLHRYLIFISYISMVALVGVVWEFAEFTLDTVLGWNWQPSLADTMSDLALDLVGGLVFLILYGFYWKKRGFPVTQRKSY